MSRYPDELLAHADKLLRPARGKPTQADLRRAVSAAYYALFHRLIEDATLWMVGSGRAMLTANKFAATHQSPPSRTGCESELSHR